jgi:CHAP domain
MLDTTSQISPSSTSSADPDALALLARSLWEYGNGTQQQTSRLFTNRQTAAHGPSLANLAKRLTTSGEAMATVSRDFAHADQRAVSLLLGITQTVRSTSNAPKGKSFATRSPKRAVGKRKVGAAVVSRKKTVTRGKRVAPKPIRKADRNFSVVRGRSVDLSRIISTLEVRALLRLAASQIGVKEQRTNRTKYGRWYGMNGQAWCAMFVSWVGAHAGVWMPKINSNRGFAAVVSARSFARKHNLLTTKPRVGSVFLIIGRNGKGHTGLVESINWARRTITTIEGNTNAGGSRNGDGVYRRTRKISSINGGFMLIPTSRRRTKANIANS